MQTRKLWFVILGLLVAAILALGGIAGYKLGYIRGHKLPTASSFKADEKLGEVSAETVAKNLEKEGIDVRIISTFSAKPAGSFLGYDGHKEGKRVPAGATVKVKASAGPGVPEGTAGTKVTTAQKTLEAMGVPVHYKKMIVSDTDAHPEGSVVMTYPGDGQAVPNRERGIYVGVATTGEGLPTDVLGKDVDDVVDQLTTAGYIVKKEGRLARAGQANKVVGSKPAPGAPLDAGQVVTLYYGVTAENFEQSMTEVTEPWVTEGAGLTIFSSLAVLAGTYCKTTVIDPAVDCITLQAHNDLYHSSTYADGIKDLNTDTQLYPTMHSFELFVLKPHSGSARYPSSGAGNLLFSKGWNMMELFTHSDIIYCGDTALVREPVYCDHGVPKPITDLPSGMDSTTGLEIRMDEFLTIASAGADLDAFLDSGYVDSQAQDEASKQKAVDRSRPFILKRDSSLYDETSYPYEGHPGYTFTPSIAEENEEYYEPLVAFKPGVSDETAYYLVDGSSIAWDELPNNTELSGDEDQAHQTTLPSELTGNYVFRGFPGHWSAYLEVHEDGTFIGYTAEHFGYSEDPQYPNGTTYVANFDGTLSSNTGKESDGSYQLQCEGLRQSDTPGTTEGDNGSLIKTTELISVFGSCSSATFYPKDYSLQSIPESAREAVVEAQGESDGLLNSVLIFDSVDGGVFLHAQ